MNRGSLFLRAVAMKARLRCAVPIPPACDSRALRESAKSFGNRRTPNLKSQSLQCCVGEIPGAQAASLLLPAACRQHFSRKRTGFAHNRLVACAPQSKGVALAGGLSRPSAASAESEIQL